jgi:acyl carrier protein
MNRDEIQDWLRRKLAARLRAAPQAIDVNRPLDEYGIDSMEAVALTGELETLLERRIEPTAFWDHRTVAALAAFLAGEEPPPAAADATLSDPEVDALLRKLAGGK